jgi:hypothetical protein
MFRQCQHVGICEEENTRCVTKVYSAVLESFWLGEKKIFSIFILANFRLIHIIGTFPQVSPVCFVTRSCEDEDDYKVAEG